MINPNGSTTVDEYDFHIHIDDSVKRSAFPKAGKRTRKLYSSAAGRSSEGNAPFFNIHDRDGGYIVAVGWTGQWNAKVELNNDTVRFCSKIEDPDGVLWLKKHAEEYLRVRPYFDGDIYHLTSPTRDLTAWCAVQWDRPENGDGMIQVFKREKAIYKDAYLPLRKISDRYNYKFTDLDGGVFTVSGSELLENGLHLTINESRVAKIYIYEACPI